MSPPPPRCGRDATRRAAEAAAARGVSRQHPRLAGVAVLAALLAGLAATACRAPLPDPAADNTVRALLNQDPRTLTFIGMGDRYSDLVGRLMSDPLVGFGDGLEIEPALATSWEVSDDHRQVTFHLRPGVRWHDGRPLTARDVVFTVETIRDPASEARGFVTQFDGVSVEAPDDRTVVARYAEPRADPLQVWWVPILPQHAAGDQDLLTGEFSRRPIGCGPFRFVEYVPGQRLVLEAFEDHWAGRPRIDRLIFRIFPDERTGYQAFLKGEIDLMPVTPSLWQEAEHAERPWPIARLVYYRLNVWYVAWNQDGSNRVFTEARVRRAMIHALDRRALSDSLIAGLALPAVTAWHPASPWTDPTLEPWPHDPHEARRLLDAAGWTDADGDGLRERSGEPLAFTLTIPVSSQEIVDRIAVWMQDSLADVGVRMEIDKLEGRAFRERLLERRFQAMMSGIVFDPDPDNQFDFYHSTGDFNYAGLSDPQLDALLEQGRRTRDREARLRIYHRAQRRAHELEPVSCLFNFPATALHDARLHGIQASPLDSWRVAPGPRAWYWNSTPAGD